MISLPVGKMSPGPVVLSHPHPPISQSQTLIVQLEQKLKQTLEWKSNSQKNSLIYFNGIALSPLLPPTIEIEKTKPELVSS